MPKRKNTVRPDGYISVQVYLGTGEDGKRKTKTVYGKTQKEADDKARQVKLSMRKGIDISASKDTFGEWAQYWLQIKATEISAGRQSSYESLVNHLNAHLEHIPISKITTYDVQGIITALAAKNPNTGKPMARKTLLGLKNTVVQILRFAIDSRVMDYNAALPVKIPKAAETEHRRALAEEEQLWITNTSHRAQTAAMIMMYAGLRRGELVPLLWNDIDIENRTISVTKTVERISGSFKMKSTAKTAAGIRTINIPIKLAEYLRHVPKEGLYVCLSARSTMHTPASWKRLWESYITDLNFEYGDFSPFERQPKSKFDPAGVPLVIPNITPHWLRHTFATMLYFAGVDILTAMKQMGHSDIKTTMEIYTHLDDKHKRKEIGKLDAFLENASIIQVDDI